MSLWSGTLVTTFGWHRADCNHDVILWFHLGPSASRMLVCLPVAASDLLGPGALGLAVLCASRLQCWFVECRVGNSRPHSTQSRSPHAQVNPLTKLGTVGHGPSLSDGSLSKVVVSMPSDR